MSETMSSIDDEIVRAKMRQLRVSTFADIFYEVDLPETIELRRALIDSLPNEVLVGGDMFEFGSESMRALRSSIVSGRSTS